MERVKSALEKALEKASMIGELTKEEKETLKEQELVRSALAEFYKGKSGRDALAQQLKDLSPRSWREAQLSVVSTIRLESTPEEFAQKKDAVMTIETLKGKKNTSALDNAFKSVERLQKDYGQRKEGAIAELRRAVEENPQLRMRPMRTPDGRTILQPAATVDEVVQTKMAEYLSELQMTYEEVFVSAIDALKGELR